MCRGEEGNDAKLQFKHAENGYEDGSKCKRAPAARIRISQRKGFYLFNPRNPRSALIFKQIRYLLIQNLILFIFFLLTGKSMSFNINPLLSVSVIAPSGAKVRIKVT